MERAAAQRGRAAARLPRRIAWWWSARRGSTRSSRCAAQMSREEFLAPLGLDPVGADAALRLLVAVRVGARAGVRAASGCGRCARRRARRCAAATSSCGRIPTSRCWTPDVAGRAVTLARLPQGCRAWCSRPFDDARALVLRTSDRAHAGRSTSALHHSAAVVGLNTSAELEAAIVGRPVYTVLAGDGDADGQASTLHFHYLLERAGRLRSRSRRARRAHRAARRRAGVALGRRRHPALRRGVPPAARHRSAGVAAARRGARADVRGHGRRTGRRTRAPERAALAMPTETTIPMLTTDRRRRPKPGRSWRMQFGKNGASVQMHTRANLPSRRE